MCVCVCVCVCVFVEEGRNKGGLSGERLMSAVTVYGGQAFIGSTCISPPLSDLYPHIIVKGTRMPNKVVSTILSATYITREHSPANWSSGSSLSLT